MTEYLMSPVNLQYFEMADLVGQGGLIGVHTWQLGGLQDVDFSGRESQPGFICYPVISNYFGRQIL